MDCKTIHDVDVRNRRVLVRVDFNVPIADGRVADDTRIRAAVPTLCDLLDRAAAVILCSHLGRPNGACVPALSLRPVAAVLEGILGRGVQFAEDCLGDAAHAAAERLLPGELLMLENTRFHAGENRNDAQMARELAELADVFVNDAFGAAHRAHASTVGVAQHLPTVAGLLLEKELDYLGRALSRPGRPFVAILGGAKISDKIDVIASLLERADRVLIGGGMANTFFRAQGIEVADSLVEGAALETARALLQQAGDTLVLPPEVVIADGFNADAAFRSIPVSAGVPVGWRILDIGSDSVERFAIHVGVARMIFWNGPMGVFELPPFAAGTKAVARLVAESDATSIVGGGDSVAAVRQSGLAEEITHISTGGGASLEFLQGKVLPGVAALDPEH
ncbi:MAG: phosphoglycerate kinase [Anaerolineales bacterium]|jgi:phosphoglycerate kinase|nr:phosphoglycerate kinase [Anaerolineales bacterium]MDP7643686.1 phosphoglycerate kinase [Anaerolineales bacterium]|tara:strand:- start:178 stop:1356 length:1179 start_codon:yes stop_codon:yes gene_type:complete